MSKPDFEQLIPLVTRHESLVSDQEIAPAPNFQCYCCEDTGWIRYRLVRLVIRDYDDKRDRNPICGRCDASAQWRHLDGNIDLRITKSQCQKLHDYAKTEDEEARKSQWENTRKARLLISDLASSKNLRKGDRTDNDNREALLRKQNEQGNLDKKFEEVNNE